MSKCSFCNQAICWGEVNESGKVYHPKCTPSARGVDNSAQIIYQQKEDAERAAHMASFNNQPKVIGEIAYEEQGAGFTVDPLTGEKKPLAAGQRFANPRVGKK
eukprot:TRINITY_DN54_c3_g1_i1.p1 TRINITY_DN54_c3_g1~~TRINITY_DN54_c3_g1_i1.p1  ORF type:complete len:103 (+),score=47.39 TRINITY_DN54_c3_g1_i1:54-362(+)